MLLPARPLAGDGPLRARARCVAETIARDAERRASTPVVPEHGSLGASGDLAPLAHCALALIGEGEVCDARRRAGAGGRGAGRRPASSRPTSGQGGPGADQRHRRDPRHARARPRRPRRSAARSPTWPRRCRVEALLGHRPRLRRRPDRAAPAAGPGRQRRQPAPPAGGLADRRQPPRRTIPASRTPTRCAARRRFTAPPATPSRTPTRSPRPSSSPRSTTRWSCPTGGSSRAGTSTARRSAFACDFLAIAAAEVGAIAERRTDRLLDAARSHGLPPFLAADAGVDSGLMIAQYTQAAMVAENRRLAAPAERRLAADQRDAGGSRLDGLGGGAQAAHRRSTTCARILAVELALRPPAGSSCAPRSSPARGTGAALAAVRDAGRRPRAGPLAGPGARGGRGAAALRRRCWPPSRRQVGELRDERATPEVRAPRGPELSCRGWPQEAALRMLMNNLDPEVAERPDELVVYGGTGRAARSWDAFDAIVRELRGAGRRRDPARPVGQAGRRVQDPRMGAARPDRELEPGRRVGELGRVPPPRGARADHVRPDDGRLVDLHRQPGHRAGDLRVLRRDRPAPVRRLAGGDDHA